MTRIKWYGPTIVLLVTIIIAMIAGPKLVQELTHAHTESHIQLVQHSLSQNPTLADLSDSFRKVAEVVEPSVVHIKILSKRSERAGSMSEDLLREWFFGPRWDNDNDLFDRRNRPDRDEQDDQRDDEFKRYEVPQESGNGSGWVYDNDGHIITNYHVIENADEIQVRFNDGSELTAEVVGSDVKTDVAVLKVDSNLLHPAKIADHDIRQGEIVFAFGSPFRFDFSMSQGIVSAKGRRLGIIGPQGYENFIQTDAAINPGNSGGPLTNIYGEVVGMNTAIATRTGAYSGLGFAIPVDMVKEVVDQIISTGKVSRGYLGIYIEDLNEKMAKTFEYEGEGVLVVNPIEGSPAAVAGIEAGDIITRIEDQAVTSSDELRYKVAGYAPGTVIQVEVFREGEIHEFDVKLDELPGTETSMSSLKRDETSEPVSEGMKMLNKLGIEEVEPFDRETAERLDVQYEPGVMIRSVRDNSVAASVGLGRGVIITRVMNEDVSTVDELIAAIEQYDPSDPIRLRVMQWNPREREFMPRFEVLELPEE